MQVERIEISVLSVAQPIGTFYVGVMNAVDLFHASFADVRNLEDRDLDLYIGIQRPLSPSRVKEIEQYIGNVDATFPTGIILSTTSNLIEFDSVRSIIRVDKRGDIFRILDGQHRVVAFEAMAVTGMKTSFQLPVMIFVDMDVEDQAQVFATINLAQTKVNKSLAYDLFQFSREPSPQKTAHQVARLMNRHVQSPYLEKVKILGRADLGGELLTQAAIVDKVLPMITVNKRYDRDLVKRGGWPTATDEGASSKTVFRRMWVARKDEEIGKTVLRYFIEISERWPDAWRSDTRYMLPKTNGFISFMNLLGEYLMKRQPLTTAPERSELKELLSKVDLTDESFNTKNFVPGSSGQADLTRELRRALE